MVTPALSSQSPDSAVLPITGVSAIAPATTSFDNFICISKVDGAYYSLLFLEKVDLGQIFIKRRLGNAKYLDPGQINEVLLNHSNKNNHFGLQ